MTNGNTYWECDKRRSGSGCKVKVILDDQDHFIQQTGEHTHPADPEKVAADTLRSGMKREARSSNATTTNVISQSLLGENENVLAKLPKMDTMRRDISRQRAAHAAYRGIPDDQDTLFPIPHQYTISSTGDVFLQHDNGRADRMLIFETGESLNFLQNSENCFMDGTFSTAPPQFAQLYSVHGLSQGRHVVGAYGLLPNKRLETYIEFLDQIQGFTNFANPQSVMIDFEQSMMG